MSAAYEVVGTSPGHLDLIVRNTSAEPWRASEGFAVSYHLFDSETGTLVVDGARVHPGRDIQPGESMPVHLDFDLPPDDGNYQVLVSPMREGVCWYYEQGWPFVVVEGHELSTARVATRSVLRREQTLRSVQRALVYPIRTIWRNRGLIRVMVRRDILGRYRGSFGGSFWTVFNPLLLMLTYLFVFGWVLDTKFPDDPSRSGFALYFLAGCCRGSR